MGRQLAQFTAEGRKPSKVLLLEPVQQVFPWLHRAYALARKAAPLLIGLGEGEFLCASDTPAPGRLHAHDSAAGGWGGGVLAPLGIELYDAAGERVQRTPNLLSGMEHVADKRSFRHFMLQEIHHITAHGA